MTLKQVKPENVNTEIKITGTILEAKQPKPVIRTALFECQSCMKQEDRNQDTIKKLQEPAVCTECGNRKFKLLQDESTYTELQEITVTSQEKNLKVYLKGTLCNYDYKFLDSIIAYGVLKVMLCDDRPNYYYLVATSCNKRR